MPLKPFLFENTDDSDPSDRNWRQFSERSKTIIRNDLTMVSPVSDPIVNYGYFTLYGPLVFYVIKMTLDSNDGWTTSSYISLPFPEFVAATTRQVTHLADVYVGSTGARITTAVMTNTTNSERLAFAAAYTNVSGADQEVFIQGWYFRN